MMEGYLDISGCSYEWRERILVSRIPVRVGEHEKDLDVIEFAMDPDELKELRAWIEDKYRGVNIRFNKDWPIGFDLKSIPSGAVLHLES